MMGSAGRSNRRSGRRVSAMSKKCKRIVNGGGGGDGDGDGGFVNQCEQVNRFVVLSNKLRKLRDRASNNLKLLEEYKESVNPQNERISQLINDVHTTKVHLELSKQHILEISHEIASREENLDVLPFAPVSSTCSSGMGDLSSAKQQDQQEQQAIKPKKRRLGQAATTQPNPDPLETNQTKQPESRTTRAKSAKIGKMQELSSIKAEAARPGYYDPVKDKPVKTKNINSHLEPCFEPDLSLRKSKKKTKRTC